mmetsp:Transcript_38230/g.92505  ORF Transcript_38230/g.92505 Transcript_38230/m.92505 type:complete len:222 (-) Transcript_38230:21-686(-)
MLVVTSTKGMLYWILSNTTNLGPAVALDGVLVVGTSSLEHGLISSASSSNNTNLGSDVGGDSLLTTRWKTNTRGSLVFIVTDNNGKGSRASGKGTTVSTSSLDIADNGSLRDHVQRKNVSNIQSSLLSAVDKLSSVHSFGTDKQFRVSLVSVSIQELNLGNGSTSTRVMEDFLDDAANISLLFGIVQGAKLDSTLASSDVRLEDWRLTLTLSLHVFTHGEV